MEASGVLHEIVAIEYSAKKLYNEAMDLQSGYDGLIEKEANELHEKLCAKADKRIEEFEKKKVVEAESHIAELDVQHKIDMDRAREAFETSKEQLAMRAFEIVVDKDA